MRDGLLPFKVFKTSKKQMNIIIIFSVAFHSFPFQHIPPSIDVNVRIFQQQASPVHVFFFFHRNTVLAFTAYCLHTHLLTSSKTIFINSIVCEVRNVHLTQSVYFVWFVRNVNVRRSLIKPWAISLAFAIEIDAYYEYFVAKKMKKKKYTHLTYKSYNVMLMLW